MTEVSRNARVAGILYIAASAVGVVRLLYVPEHLFVTGNATATAGNIAAHESLFRLGIVTEPVAAALWLFVPMALYRLLKGVDQTLAALMVILGAFMQVPLYFFNAITDAATLLLVRGRGYLSVVDKPQREAFAMLFLNLHHRVDVVNSIFAGLWLIPFGLLVYRSRFLPRFLGVWLMAACFGWLAFSFTGLASPGDEERVYNLVQPLVLGEVATMLWLVILGARERRPAVAGP